MSVKKFNGTEVAGVRIALVDGMTSEEKVFQPREKKAEGLTEKVDVPEVPAKPATEKEEAVPAIPAHQEDKITEYFKVPLENDNCYRLRDLTKKQAKEGGLGEPSVKFTFVDADRNEIATEEDSVDLALSTISSLKW
jgi:hypothetical protein